MTLSHVVPVLRMFDETATRAFWCDFLGFAVQFEHRHALGLPLYMGIVRDDTAIHLTQHHGDACPGAAIRIVVRDIDGVYAALPKDYGFARPGPPAVQPWGIREFGVVTDPSGNRLTFAERTD